MAINLTGTDNLSYAAIEESDFRSEFTCAITINISSMAVDERLFGIWGATFGTMTFLMAARGTSDVGIAVRPASDQYDGYETSGASISGLSRIAFGVKNDGTSSCYVNGSSKTTQGWTGLGAWTSGDTQAYGSQPLYIGDDGAANAVDGDYAEVAWWARKLTDPELEAYSNGVSPLLIKPEHLYFYAPLYNTNFDSDLMKGKTATATGAANAAHPGFIYPSSQIIPFPETAAAAQTISILSANMPQPGFGW
jgi:hypothetical protein